VAYRENYPEGDLIGLSINAQGITSPVQDPITGNVTNRVDEITEAVSCDLVTKAGAKGKVLLKALTEGLKEAVRKIRESKGEIKMEAKQKEAIMKTCEALAEIDKKIKEGAVDGVSDALAGIMQTLQDLTNEEKAEKPAEEGEVKPGEEKPVEEKPVEEGKGDAVVGDKPADKVAGDVEKVTESLKKENSELKSKLAILEGEKKLALSKGLAEKKLKEAHFPAGTYEHLVEVLVGKDEKYMDKVIKSHKALLENLTGIKTGGNAEKIIEGVSGQAKNPFANIPLK